MSKLGDLAAELENATQALSTAEEHAKVADRQKQAALNKVNELQKALDAEISQLRTKPPAGTNWARNKETGECNA